nr:hypothetical protein [Lachnoclostridium phocaeense]
MILRRSARNYLLSVFLYSLDKMPFLSARKQAVRQKIYLKALEIRKCRRSYFIENHLEQEVNPMYLASLLENIKYGILPQETAFPPSFGDKVGNEK